MKKLRISYGRDPAPSGGGFYWPESPSKRLELLSVKRNNPAVFESVYQCRPGQREGSIFLESDFAYYDPPKGLSDGVIRPEIAFWCSKFHALIGAWDTAFEATAESDHTVGLAAGLLPCDQYHCGEDPLVYGPCEPHLDIYILDLIREKLDWGDLVKTFRSFHRKWQPLLHVVEKRGTGISLYQSMNQINIAVEGVMTTEGKRARAVSGTEAGSVQGWFRQHRVLLPKDTPWVPQYKIELKDFTGEDDADDDQVDATVHLVNYAIQTGGGMAMISSEWTPERVNEIIDDQANSPDLAPQLVPANREMLAYIHMSPQFSNDPFEGMCHRCDQWEQGYCKEHKRQTVALDTCHLYLPRVAVA